MIYLGLIGAELKRLTDEQIVAMKEPFFIYKLSERDFITRPPFGIECIVTDVMVLDIGGMVVRLPENMHLLIGDFDGGLDVIRLDELIGRDFDAVVVNADFAEDSMQLMPIRVIGVERHEVRTPMVHSPYPVALGDNKAILVSTTDIYSDVSKLAFSDIV